MARLIKKAAYTPSTGGQARPGRTGRHCSPRYSRRPMRSETRGIPSSSIRKSSTKSRKSKWISAPFSKAEGSGREPTMTIDVLPLGGSPTSAIFPIVPTPYEAESVQGNPQSSRKQRTGFVSEYGAKWADRRRRNGGKRCLKPFAFLFVVRPFGEICSALFQGKYLTLVPQLNNKIGRNDGRYWPTAEQPARRQRGPVSGGERTWGLRSDG